MENGKVFVSSNIYTTGRVTSRSSSLHPTMFILINIHDTCIENDEYINKIYKAYVHTRKSYFFRSFENGISNKPNLCHAITLRLKLLTSDRCLVISRCAGRTEESARMLKQHFWRYSELHL